MAAARRAPRRSVIPAERSTFQQIAVLLAAAVGIGLVAAVLRQPLIVAYILIGHAVGLSLVGWAAPAETLGVLAQFGVALLLFAVGLELDPRLVRHLGPVALATGLGQLAFTIAFGFVIALGLGYDAVAALYVAVALTVAVSAVVVGVAMRFLGPVLSRCAAHSGEMVGFTSEAGAFLAGFPLAATPFREAIASRIAGVRDFLLLLFFVELGMRLVLGTRGAELSAAAVLSLFVLIGNLLIVVAIMGYVGYRKRTSFLAGMTVAQISEFPIVFMAMGVALGHVGNEALALVTTVGIVTIAASTYMILYSGPLYARLEPWLGPFERRVPFREARGALVPHGGEAPEVLVFGLGRCVAQIAAAGRSEADERVLRRARPDRLLNPFEDAAGFAFGRLD